MAAGRSRMGVFMTETEKLVKGIWPWDTGVRARLPNHFKQRHMELYQKKPVAVHYRPDPAKYKVDEFGERSMVQNVPFPITFPEESHKGLWGGEGIIAGYYRKDDNEYKPLVPRLWRPRLIKRVFYSEILDRWMGITVTSRTLDLIDEVFGFDFYILKTHAVDLQSRLGLRIKREMLLTLAQRSMYPNDPEKNERIHNKFKEFIIPKEEADWVGLTLEEAEIKQEGLEEVEKQASIRPMKEVYMKQLIQELQENKHDALEEGSGWLSKMNPFVAKKTDEKS